MTTPAADSSKLKRIIIVLAVVCALLVGLGAGLGIALANAPRPEAAPAVTVSVTATPTPSATPTPTPSASKKVVANNEAPAQSCPAGGLTIKLNGGLAHAEGQLVSITATYLFTNTSPTHAIKVNQSAMRLWLVNNAGVGADMIRAWLTSTPVIDKGKMRLLVGVHESFQLNDYNNAIRVTDSANFRDIKASWVGSDCTVPLTDGGRIMAKPPLR